jgi:hypothetical protein
MSFVDMSLDRQREINARQRALEASIAGAVVEGGDEARRNKREDALRAAALERDDQLRNEQRMIQQTEQDYNRNMELAKYGIAPGAPQVKNALGQEVMGPPTEKQTAPLSIFDKIAQEGQKEKDSERQDKEFDRKVKNTQYDEEYVTPFNQTRKAKALAYANDLEIKKENAKRLNAPKNFSPLNIFFCICRFRPNILFDFVFRFFL